MFVCCFIIMIMKTKQHDMTGHDMIAIEIYIHVHVLYKRHCDGQDSIQRWCSYHDVIYMGRRTSSYCSSTV